MEKDHNEKIDTARALKGMIGMRKVFLDEIMSEIKKFMENDEFEKIENSTKELRAYATEIKTLSHVLEKVI